MMSVYDLNQMIKKWDREELTIEQAVGQLLLHLQAFSKRVGTLERRMEVARQVRGGVEKQPIEEKKIK